jgi:cytochrome c-type biogenesis protein CcmF
MLGSLLIKLAFVACLVSVAAYVRHHLRETPQSRMIGRIGFLSTVLLVLLSAGTLLTLILTHQFQYTYVWSYSSRDLSTPLLISTFYAGQEGSFLLWSLFTALIGLFLMRHSSKHGYEAQVMSVFGGIELLLLLLLLVKSPFLYVWESYAGEVAAGFQPADGRGLNPLLQNYWMVIHPQVLFSGFASMSVPYAYAIAAMLKRDYDSWYKPATPWLVFGTFVLGTGIIMGGIWAYETLGWGGYWGWDPVENSSLVPWLVGVAGIHTILSQRKRGAFVRTNLFLGVLCFVLVVYSTFLTRSGVLGDTSVHSFVDPGMTAYWLLIGMLGVAVALPVVLFIRRWKEFPRRPARHHYISREFALFLGASALVIMAVLVIVGTSSPLITDIMYGKKSAVDISYYSRTTMPLGVILGLLAGLGQLLWWTKSDLKSLLRALIPSVAGALLTVAVLVVFGITAPLVVALFAAAAFALIANVQVGLRIAATNPKTACGALAHIGVAIMLIGFVASSEFDRKQTVSLAAGQSAKALGYTLTYEGAFEYEKERFAFHVRVDHEGKSVALAPVMYFSKYNNGVMRHPDIANLWTQDFYLAPLSLENDVLVVEASVKPFINLVWTGVVVLLLGFLVTIFRRAPEAGKVSVATESYGVTVPMPYLNTSSPPNQAVASSTATPAESATR